MPDYLTRPAYVADVPPRPRPIASVGTTTTGFVGPTRRGPLDGEPRLLTSFAEFQRIYGGLDPLTGAGAPRHNYLAHAVRTFFANGGTRLYVARVREGADAEAYAGTVDPSSRRKSGLKAFEELTDIALVAAPGSTAGPPHDGGRAIARELIAHCERMRYRIAVLDAPEGRTVEEVRQYRAGFNAARAALYYPWVRIEAPVTGAAVVLPPSGFVTGIYARVDAVRGVHTAPDNEVVRLAVGLERDLSPAQQEVLGPEGINCLRSFGDCGYRVSGARTATSDPEWQYVAMRRYLLYLERSIEQGSEWAVFEPNGPRLWEVLRRIIETFLVNEWRAGRLLGAKPEEAFFVRCDSSTMTRNDLDNGRLICEVGVAPLRPAEFVVFRIGHKTASSGA
jgi:phage tail sheath protein FI